MARVVYSLVLLLLLSSASAEQTMVVPEADTAYVARDVTVTEAMDQDGKLLVLDVRTPAEFSAGHIEGALNIDVNDPAFAERVARLDRSQSYLVHCSANVPNGRSARAMSTMTKLGFEDIGNLVGGFAAWDSADGEIVTRSPDAP